MERYEFDVDLNEIYTDTMHWDDPDNDHRALLKFKFERPVNGLDHLVVFCTANDRISTREDPKNKRLETVYPFSAYASFARFHSTNVPAGGHVYGVWETDGAGNVTKFALQLSKPDSVAHPVRRAETDESSLGA